MQTNASLLTIVVFASSALAQQATTLDRVLHFTATDSPQNMEEITTLVRSVTDIPEARVDATEKALSLRGTAAQIALAEWLFTNLDRSASAQAGQSQNWAKHEYRASNSIDDIVRLFYLTNPEIPQGVQEVATAVRSLANVPRLFTYDDLRAVAVRGTDDQVKLVEFLFAEMDEPPAPHLPSQASRSSASPEFRMAEGQENLVRVFYVPDTSTAKDFQEVAVLVRTITNLRRLFTYNAPRAIAVRGTDDQIALAEWLFADLDRASVPQGRQDSGKHEYRLSPTSDEFVRVFYLTHADTPQGLQQTATQVRSKTDSRWVLTYSAPSAIAIRGTAEQIAVADRLIQERDR